MKKFYIFGILTTILLTFTFSKHTYAAALQSWRIGTYNIRNFGSNNSSEEKRVLKQILKKASPHLMAIQEVIDANSFKSFISINFPNYGTIIGPCGGSGRQKLGFIYDKRRLSLIRWREDSRVKKPGDGCNKGLRPLVVAEFKEKLSGQKFIAMSAHLKAGGKDRDIAKRSVQFKRITTILKDFKSRGFKDIILMGDLNTTEYLARNRHYQRYTDFVSNNDMEDLAKRVKCTSYWSGENTQDDLFQASLLDHVLITTSLLRKFARYRIKSGTHCNRSACREETVDSLGLSFKEVSDHCPVLAELK